jgi:hypothetical protein
MDQSIIDAVRFLLSQHLDHFHPKVRAQAQELLSRIPAEAETPKAAQTAEQSKTSESKK